MAAPKVSVLTFAGRQIKEEVRLNWYQKYEKLEYNETYYIQADPYDAHFHTDKKRYLYTHRSGYMICEGSVRMKDHLATFTCEGSWCQFDFQTSQLVQEPHGLGDICQTSVRGKNILYRSGRQFYYREGSGESHVLPKETCRHISDTAALLGSKYLVLINDDGRDNHVFDLATKESRPLTLSFNSSRGFNDHFVFLRGKYLLCYKKAVEGDSRQGLVMFDLTTQTEVAFMALDVPESIYGMYLYVYEGRYRLMIDSGYLYSFYE